MTYRQAKKLKIGDKIRLKPNEVHPDGKLIPITEIKEETPKNSSPIVWFKDTSNAWHWHKFHHAEQN